jgi:autotransporter-associated beta strand protein
METNSNVLDVLQRITEAEQYGAATNATGGVFPAGANFKRYDPATNEGHVQFQQRDVGTDFKTVTIFALLQQSGANVTIKINTAIFGTGAAERPKVGSSTYHIGVDNSTTGSSIPLATTNTSAGAGIRKIQMSGIVYLTGSISFSGTIQTLASTQSLNDGNNAYSRKRIGAFGITGATLPATISNAGFFSLNASSALTLSGAISSDGTTAQFGEPVTLTGANTFNGYTIITSGKVLNVGNGGSTGAIQGNIENYGSLTFNRSDSIAYTGIITGTGSVTKSGASALTMTGLNTYTGATTINAGRLIIQQNIPTSSSSGYSGSGILVIQPNSNSFTSAVTYPIPGFTVSSSIGGLTVGKTTNTANITVSTATTAAGPIALYGGTLTLNQNVSSSAGGNISLYGNTLTFGSGKTVSSTGELLVAPQSVSNTIGVAGATGTLQVTTTHLSTNFTNGFSTVQIGSSSQTGNISTNVFTLQDDMSFLTSGTLTLGGKLIMGSNNVTLGSAISAITGTPSYYFQTNGTGTLSRTVANSASLIFPIGNAYYNPVTITNNTGSSDAFSMKVRDDVLEFGTTGSSITKAHVDVTWDINKTNANANSGVNFTLQWESAQERNSISSFALNHYNSSISAWEFAAGSSASASGSTTKTMSHTGYTGSFSPFAIGDGVSALPVQLLHFDAILQNKNALLTWSTATENNNSGFEIMKSTDGQKWKSIGFVKGAGTTFETQKYRFVDYAFNTLAYYKLHQIDFNGIATPSPVRTLQSAASETPKVIVYPNPSNGKITVATGDLVAATFELYDATGRILEKGNLSQPHFDITGLTKGIYFLKVYYSMGVETLKICVE